MPEINKNLRILSLAYSNGKLTKEQYTSLRSKQLSAIEFGKPFPPLPPGLSNVNVPNVKIDVPSGGSRKKSMLIIAGIAVLAAIVAGIYFLSTSSDDDTPNKMTDVVETSSPNAMAFESLAKHLASNKAINADELKAYTEQWNSLGKQQQKLARKAPWFNTLTSSLTKMAAGAGDQATLAGELLSEMGMPAPQKPESVAPTPAESMEASAPISQAEPEEPAIQATMPTVASEPDVAEGSLPAEEISNIPPANAIEEVTQPKDIEPLPSVPVETAEPVVAPTEVLKPMDPLINDAFESATEAVEEVADTPSVEQIDEIQATTEQTINDVAEEHIPSSTKSGVDLAPEYEREPEFGKAARDALFSDTPEY